MMLFRITLMDAGFKPYFWESAIAEANGLLAPEMPDFPGYPGVRVHKGFIEIPKIYLIDEEILWDIFEILLSCGLFANLTI